MQIDILTSLDPTKGNKVKFLFIFTFAPPAQPPILVLCGQKPVILFGVCCWFFGGLFHQPDFITLSVKKDIKMICFKWSLAVSLLLGNYLVAEALSRSVLFVCIYACLRVSLGSWCKRLYCSWCVCVCGCGCLKCVTARGTNTIQLMLTETRGGAGRQRERERGRW